MNIMELREKLKYDLEHPKCKRCGKELYLPMPPKELIQNGELFYELLLSNNT